MSQKNLVIVESPAKAKTIAGFLGNDYQVKSSLGHIRDLPKKGIGVDVPNNFEPTYEVGADKKKVVAELRAAAKGNTVWLASDEDREGEAIAWHVAQALGLDPATTKRIVFHEITKPAIEQAIANPRTIDMKLVDAQQARRILDRLVGYELSPVLWKKVRTGLSAGRVQSVAVRLIVEREREIKAFAAAASFKVTATFSASGQEVPAELNARLQDEPKAKEFLNAINGAEFKIGSIDQKGGTRSPGAPFTTSTLQQEAARRLGYSVRQTMTIAQKLYESGHITYMRTDSTNLSPIAITAAKAYITKTYGENYVQVRQFKTKNKSAQEAHEAIRPTNLSKLVAGADDGQKRLYGLIWQRALASQMVAAQVQKTEVVIDISTRPEKFLASGEVLTFDGYLKVYGGGKEDKILPAIKQGEVLDLGQATALESFNRAAARYSEASLVRKLEELGIGRPSTYAPTISTIQDRGYIEKTDVEGTPQEVSELILKDGKVTAGKQTVILGADRSKLLPTHVADVVTDFLVNYFADILDYDFTAHAEAEFDEIAEGKFTWQEMLHRFYDKFHPLVVKSEGADRAEAAQARQLGVHPKSGKPVVVRYGRYGPVLQLGNAENKEEKVQFAPLPAGSTIDDVDLEKALPMFNLPRIVGKTVEGEDIMANIGRFGPYVNVGKLFVSLKDIDPLVVTEAEARELIQAKQKTEAKKLIADFGALKILDGPYGPYITDGKKNARVPKDTDAKKITEAEAKDMLAKAPVKKWRGRSKRAKAKK